MIQTTILVETCADSGGIRLTTLPTFDGTFVDECVDAWKRESGVALQQHWKMAAIAARLERTGGGRQRHGGVTAIQQFCKEVAIDRQTFQRYSHTYSVFSRTCTNVGTSFPECPTLSFSHYEVAARLADDPIAAIVSAHDKRWSVRELERQLRTPPTTGTFSLAEATARLREQIQRELASWPFDARVTAPDVLRELADDLDARVLPPLATEVVHAIRWIQADMENIPFSPRNFNPTKRGRGGDLEVSGGAAGAPIYQLIVGDVSHASRSRVLHAINNLLIGKLTPLGQLVLGVARDLSRREPSVVRAMTLPPDAGDVPETLCFEDDDEYEQRRDTATGGGADPFLLSDIEEL